MNRFNLTGKGLFLALSGLIVILDQVSKIVVKNGLHLFERIEVIPGFFYILYIRNSGAVWGLFAKGAGTWLQKGITILSIFALALVMVFFLRISRECRLELAGLSLVAGGAVGNLVDRLIDGSVVDFLHFSFGSWSWPTFNLADSAITIGVCLLMLSILRGKGTAA
ncbi:MAG TPA: signal peptidase II [Candidatus Aminicenantes bacterium]|nr:signal peptidase II [Candidatus Aminicenantes bacterium]